MKIFIVVLALQFASCAMAMSSSECLLTICGIIKASYVQNFLNLSALPSGIAYSGFTAGTGSCAPFSSGIISIAAAGPCFDHTLTGSALGLRDEGTATSIVTYSQNMANAAAWSSYTSGTGSVVATPSSGTAPDGSNNAALITFSRADGTSYAQWRDLLTATNVSYSGSVYIKAYSGADVGKQVAVYSYGSSIIETNVTLSSAWTRVFVLPNVLNAGAGNQLGMGFNGGDGIVPSTVNILVWGGQLEAASFASSYIPTTTASATRSADSVTLTGSTLAAANAGPTILESQSEQTGVISRQCFAPGTFAFPAYIWARKLAIYQPGQTCANLTNAGYLNTNNRLQ